MLSKYGLNSLSKNVIVFSGPSHVPLIQCPQNSPKISKNKLVPELFLRQKSDKKWTKARGNHNLKYDMHVL